MVDTSNSSIKLFVNGIQVGSDTYTGTLKDYGTTAYRIGTSGTTCTTDWSFCFDGLIDDVRIYNRALSAAEISQLYALGAARIKPDKPQANVVKDSSLVGYWSFNGPDIDNTSNIAYDRSGSGNNGTMTNMATSSRYAIGKSGQALKFDGVDDYVSMGNPSSYQFTNAQSFSISLWLKTNDLSGFEHLAGKVYGKGKVRKTVPNLI